MFGKVTKALRALPLVPAAIFQLIFLQIQEHTHPKKGLASVGSGTHLERSLSLRFERNITIGKNVIFGPNNFLWASPNAKLVIDDDALLAPNVSIFTANHGFADLNLPINDQPESENDVYIGKKTWLGCGVVILSGVSIGEGAIVAAGAVVNRNVAPFDIVGGIPAKRIGTRLDRSLST